MSFTIDMHTYLSIHYTCRRGVLCDRYTYMYILIGEVFFMIDITLHSSLSNVVCVQVVRYKNLSSSLSLNFVCLPCYCLTTCTTLPTSSLHWCRTSSKSLRMFCCLYCSSFFWKSVCGRIYSRNCRVRTCSSQLGSISRQLSYTYVWLWLVAYYT